MPKLTLTIIILIIVIGIAAATIVLNIKNQGTPTADKTNSNKQISLEEINNLLTQATDYEAKLKASSLSGSYEGYVYVSADKTKTVYQINGKRFFSIADLNKNEIVNYDLKSKKGIRIPGQNENKESIFKNLPLGAKIITSEIINGIDCWVIEIKQGDKTEIFWISKENGIVVKKEIITPWDETTFELFEIENREITEEEMEIPEEVEIMDITSEEFVSFVQEEPDAAITASLPSLPAVSVEPSISPIIDLPSAEEPSTTPLPSPPQQEGIFEESHPKAIPTY